MQLMFSANKEVLDLILESLVIQKSVSVNSFRMFPLVRVSAGHADVARPECALDAPRLQAGGVVLNDFYLSSFSPLL